MSLRILYCFLIINLLSCQDQTDKNTVPEELLWYRTPAKNWMQALPVGNGRLGAMVFGDTKTERIQLNEDSMWAGAADWGDSKGTAEDLKLIRKLLQENKHHLVDSLIVEKFSFKSVLRSHQTMGDLYLNYNHKETISNYRRSLSLNEAIAKTSYTVGGYPFTQTVFSSAPDDVIVIYLSSDHPEGINCSLRLDRPQDHGHPTAQVSVIADNRLSMEGMATQYGGKKYSDPFPLEYGVRFETLLEVNETGGKVSANNNELIISGASSAKIILSGKTSFYHQDYQAENFHKVAAASALPIDQLEKRHREDYQRYYNRMSLELTGDKLDSLSTLERLERIRSESKPDNQLAATLYQYGRYLLISCSRPGSNPANLQGLWNRHIEAPWNADYHLNINLQMNYWPANLTDLDEMNEPLFSFAEKVLERGRKNAKEQYGIDRGAVIHHTTDLWGTPWMRAATPYWGSWIHGGGWLAQHFWEHYRFTLDESFLRERAHPFLETVTTFYLDWLVFDNSSGKWVSAPETSPENSYLTSEGKKAAVSFGSAMGHQIIKEVFENYLESAEILGEENQITSEVREKLKNLTPGVVIGPDGRILEWTKPYDEPEKGHRHMSHLYALHPGDEITMKDTAKFRAAQKTIDYRLEHGGAGTGWSRAWMINFNARLQDGRSAQENIDKFLSISTADNLFDEHPPFQIDGNFGFTSGVSELLLQSHEGIIRLLPALPTNWKQGRVTGLKARGNIKFDIEWKDHKLQSAKISSPENRTIEVRFGEISKKINLAKNKKTYLDDRLNVT